MDKTWYTSKDKTYLFPPMPILRVKHLARAITQATFAVSGLLLAASAHAAQGDLVSVTQYDTNNNGKMDRVDIAVDNTATNTWTKDGNPAYAVTLGGNTITISTSALVSAAANPVLIRLSLDEADADLTADTSQSALEVTYSQVGGDGACTDCFRDVTGDKEAPAIAANDTGAAAEIDAALPVLMSATPSVGATGVSRTNSLVFVFSEPMTNTSFDHGTEFTASPNPAGWDETFSNSDKTVTLTHFSFAKGTTYTITFVPDEVTAVTGSGSNTYLNGSGTPVALSTNAYTFITANSGGSTAPVSLYWDEVKKTWSSVPPVATPAPVVVPPPQPVTAPAPVVTVQPEPISIPAPVVVPPPQPITVMPPAPLYTLDLKVGSTGDQVVLLQKMLVAKKLLVMPKGVSYGTFGGLTRDALKKLQAGWRLPVTGMVDAMMRNHLNPKY